MDMTVVRPFDESACVEQGSLLCYRFSRSQHHNGILSQRSVQANAVSATGDWQSHGLLRRLLSASVESLVPLAHA